MRLIVAGGRDYRFTPADLARLDELRAEQGVTEIVSGGCSGADEWGEMWARSRGLPFRVFRADWKKHGKAAGPIRNRLMAQYAHAVILFPGGAGTASMRREAEIYGLTIFSPS